MRSALCACLLAIAALSSACETSPTSPGEAGRDSAGPVPAEQQFPPPPIPLGSAVLSAQAAPGLAAVVCAELKQDGVTATPLWVAWGEIERKDGSRDWSGLDENIRQLRGCGLQVGLHLQSRRLWTGTKDPPNVAEFARFAGELAARYRGQIERYSIENEANAEAIWPYEPALYFELLRAARQAIKAADPGVQVQHSGISSEGLGWAWVADLHAGGKRDEALRVANDINVNGIGSGPVQEMSAADLERALSTNQDLRRQVEWLRLELQDQSLTDAFQIHYYGPHQNLAALMRWLREEGITKPFEVWEVARRYGHQPYSDAEHAAEVARLMIAATGEGSRYTIFVRYQNWPEKHLPGLMSESGSLAARVPFRTVVERLTGATAAGRLPDNLGARGYYFSTPRGRVVALWTERGTATVRLPVNAASVRVTDMTGRTSTADPRAIPVGTGPVLVEIGS